MLQYKSFVFIQFHVFWRYQSNLLIIYAINWIESTCIISTIYRYLKLKYKYEIWDLLKKLFFHACKSSKQTRKTPKQMGGKQHTLKIHKEKSCWSVHYYNPPRTLQLIICSLYVHCPLNIIRCLIFVLQHLFIMIKRQYVHVIV